MQENVVYQVGDRASFTKTMTEADVILFAGISGDLNPAHINDVYAKQSMFKGRIVHGMLAGSLISTVLGTQLPGPGTIYLSQDLKFLKPVYLNDTLRATVEILEIREKGRTRLKTIVENQENVCVIEGEALVLLPR